MGRPHMVERFVDAGCVFGIIVEGGRAGVEATSSRAKLTLIIPATAGLDPPLKTGTAVTNPSDQRTVAAWWRLSWTGALGSVCVVHLPILDLVPDSGYSVH